jgi:hypothetical protein
LCPDKTFVQTAEILVELLDLISTNKYPSAAEMRKSKEFLENLNIVVKERWKTKISGMNLIISKTDHKDG